MAVASQSSDPSAATPLTELPGGQVVPARLSTRASLASTHSTVLSALILVMAIWCGGSIQKKISKLGYLHMHVRKHLQLTVVDGQLRAILSCLPAGNHEGDVCALWVTYQVCVMCDLIDELIADRGRSNRAGHGCSCALPSRAARRLRTSVCRSAMTCIRSIVAPPLLAAVAVEFVNKNDSARK